MRDKIPQIIKEREGIDVDMDCVKDSDKHLYYLQKKIVEEASELSDAKTQEHVVEEIVDVLEVIDAICFVKNISKENISQVQKEKYEKRGGFLGGFVMKKSV